MLPFSTDWFVNWQPNIHASMFINIHRYLLQHAHMSGISAVIKSYQLYLEQIPLELNKAPVLSLTRAWTLLRFFESKMLTLVECKKCKGNFVTHAFDLNHAYHCGLCNPPARASKRLHCEVAG
jgi:flagellar transcriptional activator FlhC